MRILFELQINDDEITQPTWGEEIRHVAKHYFKEGVSATLIVDEVPDDQAIQWEFDLKTEIFTPII